MLIIIFFCSFLFFLGLVGFWQYYKNTQFHKIIKIKKKIYINKNNKDNFYIFDTNDEKYFVMSKKIWDKLNEGESYMIMGYGTKNKYFNLNKKIIRVTKDFNN